ncbi:MAG: SprT-like domain-containing protein [Flavobacteriales bacterium]|nr:SprT-like domain-containing protein [Flavobacteriales bacterium]
MTSNIVLNKLKDHVPEVSYGYVKQLIKSYGIVFCIVKPRTTKLGDYRYNPTTKVHSISVNSDLNKYLFLITFIHEMAHYRQEIKNRRRTAPHGKEWKIEFHTLMAPLLEESVFPNEISKQLSKHMQNPRATCSDSHLMRLLKVHDEQYHLVLEDLSDGDLFKIHNKQTFKRIKKLRTRYECLDISTNRKWFVHALTKVEFVN